MDIDVKCPDCSQRAAFYPVRHMALNKAGVEHFRKSKDFEVARIFDNGYKSYALFYPGLGKSLETTNDLPDGVSAEDFSVNWPEFYWFPNLTGASFRGKGSAICGSCGYRRKHLLRWPDDAWFAVEISGETLWAPNREVAVKIMEFIASDERRKGVEVSYGNGRHTTRAEDYHLRKIPTHFLRAKVRAEVVKKLRAKLGLPAKPTP